MTKKINLHLNCVVFTQIHSITSAAITSGAGRLWNGRALGPSYSWCKCPWWPGGGPSVSSPSIRALLSLLNIHASASVQLWMVQWWWMESVNGLIYQGYCGPLLPNIGPLRGLKSSFCEIFYMFFPAFKSHLSPPTNKWSGQPWKGGGQKMSQKSSCEDKVINKYFPSWRIFPPDIFCLEISEMCIFVVNIFPQKRKFQGILKIF